MINLFSVARCGVGRHPDCARHLMIIANRYGVTDFEGDRPPQPNEDAADLEAGVRMRCHMATYRTRQHGALSFKTQVAVEDLILATFSA